MEKIKSVIPHQRLQEYKEEMENELLRILNFWEFHAIDEKFGGFIGQMSNEGNVEENAPKGGILNARILWSFSAAYRHTHKESHLRVAKRAYEYLKNYFVDKKYGGIYWSVDKDGAPFNTRKQIYALAFAIYGLSEYHMATGDQEALDLSRELFNWIEQFSFDKEEGGYLEAFSRDGNLLDDLRLSKKDRNDPKTMNTHLHILEAYANLYRCWPDKHLARQLKGLLEVFMEHIIDRETGHLMLFFNRDWRKSADLVSFGHDIEASWLLLEAAEVLGDKELIEKVEDLAIYMAVDAGEGLQPDGSLYHEYNRDLDHYDKHREWWVSAEAMVGFFNAYQLTGNPGFLDKSIGSWEFAKYHLLDLKNGEWFWGVEEDYSLMIGEDKVGFWKCPYHNARACLEVITRCEALLKMEDQLTDKSA